jgi:hypothetical protein
MDSLHFETSPGDGVGSSLRKAFIALAFGLAAVAFGFYYFGSAGMLDFTSPDFIPFPHAGAALGLVLFASYTGKAFLLSRRQGQFGWSYVPAINAGLS